MAGLLIGYFLLRFAITGRLDFGPLIGLLLLPILFLVLNLIARVVPKKLPEHLAGPVHLKLSAEGLAMATRMGEAKLKWPAYERCLESENLFLLLHSGGAHRFHIVPKRAMTAESEAAFRALVSEHLA